LQRGEGTLTGQRKMRPNASLWCSTFSVRSQVSSEPSRSGSFTSRHGAAKARTGQLVATRSTHAATRSASTAKGHARRAAAAVLRWKSCES
jgi:hypothetical protein